MTHTMDSLLVEFSQKKSKGKKIMIVSVLVWIFSVMAAIAINPIFGVAVWIFSLIVLAAGYNTYKNAKQKIQERIEYIQLETLAQFGVQDINEMNGTEFEELLMMIFTTLGYNVSLTRATGDYGVDLLIRDDEGLTAVQAKRHTNNVGIKAVQEVYTGMRHHNADYGWVITNSGFTKSAYTQAQSTGVKLIDGNELLECIIEAFNVKKNRTNKE